MWEQTYTYIRSVTFHCTFEHPDHSLWFECGRNMLHIDHEHQAFSLRMWLFPPLSYYHCVYTFQLHFSYISVIFKLHTFTPFKYCTPWDGHQTLRRRDNEQVDIPYWNVIENNVSVNASDFMITPCNLDLNSVSFHFLAT
jgi:hypothetical protein